VNLSWLALAAAGLAVLTASIAGARRPTIPAPEARVFRVVNGWPDGLLPLLWPPMQLGNLVVGTVAGLAAAGAGRDAVAGSGVVLAAALKLVVERIVRRRLAGRLEVRQRPGTSQPGAILRGRDVPAVGPSFPSGHVILVAAIACVVAPGLAPAHRWVPALLTLLVMVGRVYVGAHNPLDVTAGLGAGLALGGVLAALVG
jgi:membrane-associated phospholipid phosphatase